MSIDLAIAVPQDCPAGSGRDRWWLEWCRRDDELGSGQTGGSAREVRQGPRRRPLRSELPEGRRQDLQQVGNPQGALCGGVDPARRALPADRPAGPGLRRSEENTSELQSLMRISYAVFCLKTKRRQ